MTQRSRFIEIVEAMRGKRIVVYGDIVADRFIYGTPKRISREAPVLILRQYREDVVPGGGANAINNILSLGAIPVPVSVTGNDSVGERLSEIFSSQGVEYTGVETIDRYHTPTKTRVLGGMPHASRQQIVRFDLEERIELTDDERAAIERHLINSMKDADGVLVSDYGYGVVVSDLVSDLCRESNGRPVTLDSRYDLLLFRGITAATPNEEEAEQASGVSLADNEDIGTLVGASKAIRDKIESKALLITRGSRGMALLEEGKQDLDLIPVHGSDQVADVTGAGDTVIATFTLALAAGATFGEAARIANYAASVVVMKMGTATVSSEELRHTIERDESI